MNKRTVIPIQPVAATPEGADAELVSLFERTRKLYPRSVSGWFNGWRWGFVWLTQLIFYGLPWLPWNDRQSVLFDLATRRFYIFDLVLHPQDFIYLTALLVLSALGLFLFTAVAGRLWCGFACPQTVYTQIYMWVEQRFEGDRVARMRRDNGPWTFDRVWRRAGKHAVWIAIGLWTGFTFVGYFTPIQGLAAEARTLSFGPWEWFWVLFYGFATYGNAGHMREQVCKYMCPYARFQSAMFDHDTMIVSYDAARGDPRGARSRKADPKALGLGDCVDCTLCVQVCPTGIDIRDGLQYECIGCAACIDICNGVMDKLGYQPGLIRFSTQNGLANGWNRAQMIRRVLRPRVLIYGAILGAISIAFVTSLVLRSPFKVDVIRDRGTLARIVDNGRVENVYRLQVMNGTERMQRYAVTVDGLPGLAAVNAAPVEIGPAQARWVPVRVQLPFEEAGKLKPGSSHPIHFTIQRQAAGDDPARDVRERSTFLVPR
ncbi:cytochrome c oxidase accessory protein CcoG [Aquabacterium humicola]|uniref:cytochrome c oxidase accessory protein CcoG n=1 Tax=Aquabacterium humicola TaxID=3237377 RepID=UPI002543542B|nr:cytochrome c oxidase accessory protein CcoG [Rubrivivax pictus]